jgi:hypothetical protein
MLTLVYPAHYRNKVLIGIQLDTDSKLYQCSPETAKATQLAWYLCISGPTQYLFNINHK